MAKGKELERQKSYDKPGHYYIPQVQIKISSDYGHTADFLRQLADEIEVGEPKDFELYRGVASIEWPD